jgi:hypothetical protein
VTALAGVAPQSIGQVGYAAERLQERPTEDASAVFTASRVVTEGLELVRLAERAEEGVRCGCVSVSHLFFPSDYLTHKTDYREGLLTIHLPDGQLF